MRGHIFASFVTAARFRRFRCPVGGTQFGDAPACTAGFLAGFAIVSVRRRSRRDVEAVMTQLWQANRWLRTQALR
jgi:hypothetical protein